MKIRIVRLDEESYSYTLEVGQEYEVKRFVDGKNDVIIDLVFDNFGQKEIDEFVIFENEYEIVK